MFPVVCLPLMWCQPQRSHVASVKNLGLLHCRPRLPLAESPRATRSPWKWLSSNVRSWPIAVIGPGGGRTSANVRFRPKADSEKMSRVLVSGCQMWKFVLFLAAFSLTSVEAAEPRCDPVGESMRLIGPNLSLQELETIGLVIAARNPDAPQIPWAYGNKDWLALKGLHRPGDEIRAYEELWLPSGKPFAWGYALLRGKCILGALTTRTT